MAKKMLIDTTHPEETRVVVVDGQKLEEFDFESANRKQIAGNIYLAKVMRVEPSLQAAFVDYGGNRHGFLAFSEIHPDYYQVSAAERAAINAAQERSMAAAAASSSSGSSSSSPSSDDTEDGEESGGRSRRGSRGGNTRGGSSRRPARRVSKSSRPARSRKRTKEGAFIEREFRITGGVRVRVINPSDMVDLDLLEREFSIGGNIPVRVLRLTDAERGIVAADDGDTDVQAQADDASKDDGTEGDDTPKTMAAAADHLDKVTSDGDEDDTPESLGGEDEWDEQPLPRVRLRDYKIQDVIKRRQILLIQINKEERGNKGAAVTTYLSLAGRYCVLMPNTAKGGGISRKITNAPDRKRLKEIAGELEVPRGMGLIIRTAGAQRTEAEIKRDYEYLLRQWEAVRDLTLESYAPAAIYEEGSLIKRSIRDLYTKDISEIVVEGEAGYREATDYMKMLMPTHAKHVVQHKGKAPLFIESQVENQLAAMFNPVVQLKSGGYIVIGITEALVAIDVNSGRSTRESSIEDTATKTNLEAAEEVARQFRLRDLAGLIVIDFIDMNERRNNAAVERKIKDCLASDRARIQVGRISSFGLLEMSRQRLRPGMLETTTTPCAHCHGTGLVRSDDTLALNILREVEEEGMRGTYSVIKVEAPVGVANFLNNHKRDRILAIEKRYGIRVIVEGDMAKISPDFGLVKMKLDDAPEQLRPIAEAINMESVYLDETGSDDDDSDDDDAPEEARAETQDDAPEETSRETRGRDEEGGRRRGRRNDRRSKSDKPSDPMPVIDTGDGVSAEERQPFDYNDQGEGKGNGRRNRRGGRKRNKRNDTPREFAESAAFAMLTGRDALDRALPEMFTSVEGTPAPVPEDVPGGTDTAVEEKSEIKVEPVAETQPEAAQPVAAAEPEVAAEPEPSAAEAKAEEIVAEVVEEAAAPATKPKAKPRSRAKKAAAPVLEETTADEPERPKRKGWWSQ